MDIREQILTHLLGDRMLNTVAPIYNNSKLTLSVFQAMGITLSKSIDFMNSDLIAQIFPQTATWGLPLWEEEYGIVTDLSKTIEQRRQILMNAIYKNSPITPYRITQIIYSVTGLENKVEENYAPNTIFISVFGYIPNITELKTVLDKKIPAHTNYVIEMAEQEFIEVKSYSGIGIHEFETINVEVVQ